MIETKDWLVIIAFYHSKHFYDILFQIPNNGLTNKLPAKEDIIQLAHVTIGLSQAKSLPVSFLQNETWFYNNVRVVIDSNWYENLLINCPFIIISILLT